jgi:hypothetical protein
MEIYTVKGHQDLARDPETNTVINVNKVSYDQYVSSREAKNVKNQKMQTIEDEVATIKDDINDIKSLLKELLNGSR